MFLVSEVRAARRSLGLSPGLVLGLAASLLAPAAPAAMQAMPDTEMAVVSGMLLPDGYESEPLEVEYGALSTLDESELAGVTGQAGSLFVADRIAPNELTGGSTANFTNFTYYRMGMDVRLDMNINISKMQLGCGGVNDFLTGSTSAGSVCDLDLDYVGFMGLNSAGDRPSANGPTSMFELTRPYVEIAVKNDGTAQREVVGLKIGAQKINGGIRLGRDYTGAGFSGGTYTGNTGNTWQETSLVNQEWGGTCNPAATVDAGVTNCHTGVTSLSGFLAGVELSAGFRARATVAGIGVDIDSCIGRLAVPFATCNSSTTPFFVDAGGTRLTNLWVGAAQLPLSLDLGWLGTMNITGYGQLNLSTRPIHYLLAPNASDFYLSLQRERISWPRYEKAPPSSTAPYDSCNPAYGQIPGNGRCASAYSEPANTGWWLHAANIKLLNLMPAQRIQLGSIALGDLVSALGPGSDLLINAPRLDIIASRNCYGTQLFC